MQFANQPVSHSFLYSPEAPFWQHPNGSKRNNLGIGKNEVTELCREKIEREKLYYSNKRLIRFAQGARGFDLLHFTSLLFL